MREATRVRWGRRACRRDGRVSTPVRLGAEAGAAGGFGEGAKWRMSA